MKVKCNKIISFTKGEDLGEKSPWLIKGKTYVVYAMKYSVDLKYGQFNYCEILLESEDHNDPCFFNIDHFDITSNFIPQRWVIGRDESNLICFMPQSFFYDSFWDDLDEAEDKGMLLFVTEKKIVLNEQNLHEQKI